MSSPPGVWWRRVFLSLRHRLRSFWAPGRSAALLGSRQAAAPSIALTSTGKRVLAAFRGMKNFGYLSLLFSAQQRVCKGEAPWGVSLQAPLFLHLANAGTFEGGCGGKIGVVRSWSERGWCLCQKRSERVSSEPIPRASGMGGAGKDAVRKRDINAQLSSVPTCWSKWDGGLGKPP